MPGGGRAKDTRYRTNIEYRTERLTYQKLRHQWLLKESKFFKSLQKVKSELKNFERSIDFHKQRAEMFRLRVRKAQIRKEKLELAWGQERAEWKKTGKYYENHRSRFPKVN